MCLTVSKCQHHPHVWLLLLILKVYRPLLYMVYGKTKFLNAKFHLSNAFLSLTCDATFCSGWRPCLPGAMIGWPWRGCGWIFLLALPLAWRCGSRWGGWLVAAIGTVAVTWLRAGGCARGADVCYYTPCRRKQETTGGMPPGLVVQRRVGGGGCLMFCGDSGMGVI